MSSLNIINGNIITLDENNPSATSIFIENGKIMDIDRIVTDTETIDLNGATLIPGFIDAHFHLKNFGKRLDQLNLKGKTSLEEIKKTIVSKIKKTSHGEWIVGFGWDQNLWDMKSFPFNDFLNDLAINNPVYLTRIDGHAAWVNDYAIKKTGLSIKELNDINGGKVINGCIIVDNSMGPFKGHLPLENKGQIKKWISSAIQKASQRGITGVHDAWQDRLTIEAILELGKENNLPIRCYGMLAGNDMALLEEYFKKGHYSDEYYSIRSVKAFIDGALGSRGAALNEPYSDDQNNCGLI